MLWGSAQGPAGDSLPATTTPSPRPCAASDCLRWGGTGHALLPSSAVGRYRHALLPSSAVGRYGHALLPTACGGSVPPCAASIICGGFAGGRARCSEPLNPTPRPPSYRHGHALLPTACILGGASHTATITTPHTDGGALRRGTLADSVSSAPAPATALPVSLS